MNKQAVDSLEGKNKNHVVQHLRVVYSQKHSGNKKAV